VARPRLPVGPLLALVFGLPWGVWMSFSSDGPLWFWLIAGALAGLLYAVLMTGFMAWRHTDGGRRSMAAPPLRDATSFSTRSPLTTVRQRAAAGLETLGVAPVWTDSPGGFTVRGTNGLLGQRVEVVAETTEAGVEVTIRSEPRFGLQLVDAVGSNRENVRKLASVLAPVAEEPAPARRRPIAARRSEAE